MIDDSYIYKLIDYILWLSVFTERLGSTGAVSKDLASSVYKLISFLQRPESKCEL